MAGKSFAMGLRLLTGPLGLLIVGTLLGVPLGMSVVPFLLWDVRGDWVAFAGAVAGGIAGGAMTLIAGALAWRAAMAEIELTQRKEAKAADEVLGLLDAYAAGIETACREIEGRASVIFGDRSGISQLTRDEARHTRLGIRYAIRRSTLGIRAEDVERVIPRVPLALMVPLRDLVDDDGTLHRVEEQIHSAIEASTDQNSGSVRTPVMEGPRIRLTVRGIRAKAEALREAVAQHR